MQLLVSSEFYIKNIYLFWFFIIHINLVNTIFFFLIKSNKQVDTIGLFNKWVVLGLRNLDPFNKHVGLMLTHIIGYS